MLAGVVLLLVGFIFGENVFRGGVVTGGKTSRMREGTMTA